MRRRILFVFLAGALALRAEPRKLATEELEKMVERKDIFLLDVREPKELAELGTIKGSVNIPLSQIEARMAEIPKDRLVVAFCNRGVRAARAAEMLDKAGAKVAGVGGLQEWKEQNKPLIYPQATETANPGGKNNQR